MFLPYNLDFPFSVIYDVSVKRNMPDMGVLF